MIISKIEHTLEQLNIPPLGGALLIGSIAAVISTFIWYAIVILSGWHIGLIAVIAGIIVGKGVSIGSRREFGMQFPLLSVFLSLCSMIVSEYLIGRHYLEQLFINDGYTSITYFLPLDVVFKIIKNSVLYDPITLFFWALALYQAYKIPLQLQGGADKLQKVV